MSKTIIFLLAFLFCLCSNPVSVPNDVTVYIRYNITRGEQGDLFVYDDGVVVSIIPHTEYLRDSVNSDTVRVPDGSEMTAKYYFPGLGMVIEKETAAENKHWIIGQP